MTAQLINAEDGYHLWSERYDRELTDVFAIQDEIAQAIAAALELKLISKPARHTPNFPAYEALLKARHHARTYVPEAHARAKEYCEQAIALDPAYAAPHALLGFNYLFTTTHTGRPMPEVAPLIRREARRALELDPFETDPHFLLGSVAGAHDYNWPEAAREFQLALASPSAPAEAHWAYAGLYLSTFGRFEESSAEMRRAVEQDPLSIIWRGILMAHLVCAGKYEEALEEGLKALDIADDEIHPHLALAEAYLALGRVPEAVASAERAHRNLPQQSMATGFLAACLVRLGEKDRAEALLREMGETPTPIWGRAWYHLLCSEVARRRVVREDDRGPRTVRPGVCLFSLHRRIAGQPALGEAGAHDEPARVHRLNPAARLVHRWRAPVTLNLRPRPRVRRIAACPFASSLSPWSSSLALTSHSPNPRHPIDRGHRRSAATDHAVGFYDPRLQRVVLVGGPGDPKQDDHDTVWSWSGTGWERLTDAGPLGRVNAGAAYDALAKKQSSPAVPGRRTAALGKW